MTRASLTVAIGVVLLASMTALAPVAGAVGAAAAPGAIGAAAAPGVGVGTPSASSPVVGAGTPSDPSSPGGDGPDLPTNATNDSDPYPKVESGLVGDASGVTAASAGSERVTVVVETGEGATDRVVRAADRIGTVAIRHGTLVQVRLPRRAIPELADRPGVDYVRRPIELRPVGEFDRPGLATRVDAVDDRALRSSDARSFSAAGYGTYTSEGIRTIGADHAQAAGYDGEGVTVAVIDYGFDTGNAEIQGRIARTIDCTSGCGPGSVGGDSTHGTAAAEIVLDVAPKANLVLIEAQTYLELIDAAQWVDANDVDVVSMSLGMLGGIPIDGTSRLDEATDRSVEDGTVWAVSAGNQADDEHWNGEWRDPDGNRWHNFSGDDETMAVTGDVGVKLQWNDWDGSDQDYDLYLYDDAGNVVKRSVDTQDGTQLPREKLECTAACAAGETYHLAIRRVSASGNADFDAFFTTKSSPEYATPGRSVVVPATAEKVTAVGAVYYRSGALESFSSRGPTKDGRTKPDLVAPDGVTTKAYPGAFFGTSAAAPHAAGAAALVIDADESLSPTATERRLRERATPVTGGEPDDRAGWGLVDVDAAIRPAGPSKTTIVPDEIDRNAQDAVEVAVRFDSPPDGGDVVVQLRGPDGATVEGRTSADTDGTETVVTVDATALADGSVTARSKLVDGLGHENPAGFTAESAAVGKSTAREPGDFSVVSVSAPAEVTNGSTLSVSATVRNDGGGDAAAASIRLDADRDGEYESSEVLASKSLDLDAGQSGTLDYSGTVRLPTGDYGYAVVTPNDTDAGTLTVVENESTGTRSRHLVADRRLSSATATPGDSVVVTTRVEAVGGADDVTLSENFTPAFESVTLRNATVRNGSGTVTRENASASSIAVAATNLSDGATLVVVYVVTVSGDAAAGDAVEIAGNATNATATTSVGAEELAVEGSVAAYANENGVVDTTGLQVAVRDWVKNALTTTELQAVIRAWVSGDPIA